MLLIYMRPRTARGNEREIAINPHDVVAIEDVGPYGMPPDPPRNAVLITFRAKHIDPVTVYGELHEVTAELNSAAEVS